MTDSSRLQSSTGRLVALGHSESERDITGSLEEQRQQILSEIRFEILKQERRAGKSEADVRELQQRITFKSNGIQYLSRRNHGTNKHDFLEYCLYKNDHCGEAQNQGIQDMDELRTSQVSQIDELSRQQLRESPSTIKEPTAQISELQERVNFMNDPSESQEADSVCSGR